MEKAVQVFGKFILAAVIAALGFFGGTTDLGQSVQVALNKDKAIAQAVDILNDTTPAERKEAIEKAAE